MALSAVVDPDRLDVDELANAVDAELAPIAGVLDAAKRQARIGDHHAVDKHLPGLDLVGEPVLTDIKPGSPAYNEELFGLVAALFRVRDQDEALPADMSGPAPILGRNFTKALSLTLRFFQQRSTKCS